MNRARVIFIIFLFVFGFSLYSNILNAPFIFDDEVSITTNYEIKNLSNFKNPIGVPRYIGFLSFAINYYFNGLNTFGYHLVNVIIHIINAILVYFLIQLALDMLKCRQWAMGNGQLERPITYNLLPIACSLIFLVHPIQTQAVSYITQRFASLAALFYLLAIVLYVKARDVGQGFSPATASSPKGLSYLPLYILSLISAVLAMKTKEISFTLPFIIILYEFTFFKRFERLELFKRFLYLTPYILTLAILPLEIFFYSGGMAAGGLKKAYLSDIASLSKYDYLLTQFSVIVTYIRLLIFPVNQVFDYDYPMSRSIFEARTFLSLLFLLSIFSFAVYLYIRSCKTRGANGILASFGIFWFFITLSVESSIVPIKDVIFEHRVYLPSIGAISAFTIGLFSLVEYIKDRFDIKVSIVSLFLSIIIILSIPLSIAAYLRNYVWTDPMVMAFDMIKKSPNKVEVRNHMGGIYIRNGLLDKAEDELNRAVAIDKNFPLPYYNLGLIYEKKWLYEDAERFFKKAIEVDPEYHEAHEGLGSLYLKKGNLVNALDELETALMLRASPQIYNKVGAIYLKMGDIDTAIKAFKEAVRIDREGVSAYANLGFAYFEKGDYDKAVEMHEKAVSMMPNFANAHYGLAEVYEKKGMIDKAVRHYKEYIRYADPNERWVEMARQKVLQLEVK